MDRISKALKTYGSVALLAAAGVLMHGDWAVAQQRGRMVYNPVTRQSQPEQAPRRAPTPQRPRQAASAVQQASMPAAPRADEAVYQEYEEQAYLDQACHQAGCDCADCCGPIAGCGDLVGCGSAGCEVADCGGCVVGGGCAPATFYSGFEFTFVKPRFERNVAFSTLVGDGAGNDVFTETEFDYDLELTPRVFLGWRHCDGVGLRATWWHFDNDAAPAVGSPVDTGFGRISHPEFEDVDISTGDFEDLFTGTSHLNAYSIDLEATMETEFCGWDLGVAGGIRYAFAEQGYLAEVESDGANARIIDGRISYLQSIEGIGPTISLSASRPLTCRASLFCKARGSLLYGDGESRLSAQEDALTGGGFTFTTNRTTNRDDVLSIAEMQLGFRWQGGEPCYTFRPFLTMAMEGQVWNGAGSATSADGTLGFFGFATQLGLEW